MFLNNQFFESLICPSSKKKLSYKSNYLYSDNFKYPVINNIPILINEDNSLFKIDDFKEKNNIHYNLNKTPIISFVKSFFPSISLNLKSKANYKRISKMLDKSSKILIVGGSIKGDGIQSLYNNHNNIIEGDVHFGPQTKIIFDAHDIPFEDQSFDCIIIQAVLEHVVDPMKCVNEIYRVLSKNGIVYSETPFMQQVHMRAYDFTRFTYLGHRRLFRKFKLIDSGPCCGPGMSLAWSFAYFLKSFTNNSFLSNIIMKISYVFLFPLKYFDYFLINSKGAYDSASAYYFLGEKSNEVLSDYELINEYKGFDQ